MLPKNFPGAGLLVLNFQFVVAKPENSCALSAHGGISGIDNASVLLLIADKSGNAGGIRLSCFQ